MRKRLVALATGAVLIFAACGGDSDGDLQAFCDAFTAIDESEGFEEAKGSYGDLQDNAPEDISDKVDELAVVFEAETEEEATETIQSEGLEEDFNEVGEYAEENCEEPE